MTEKQSRQLDLILKTLIDDENTVYNIEKIHQEVLPEANIDDCRVLFHLLNKHYPTLLFPEGDASEDSF
jgi:hypothetical protein